MDKKSKNDHEEITKTSISLLHMTITDSRHEIARMREKYENIHKSIQQLERQILAAQKAEKVMELFLLVEQGGMVLNGHNLSLLPVGCVIQLTDFLHKDSNLTLHLSKISEDTYKVIGSLNSLTPQLVVQRYGSDYIISGATYMNTVDIQAQESAS